MPTNELYKIEGVEIFAAGRWNDDQYTVEDLDEMVKAFNETASTCRPYLKLGHDDNQELLQKDGLPAAGWIGALYRKGEKLVADFIDIPEKIYNLIQNKAYRNVSSEIYWNIDMGESSYKRMLSAVALLGCDMPAVSNLSDILGMYKLKFKSIGEQKSYQLSKDSFKIKTHSSQEMENLKQEGNGMPTEKEILEAQVKELEAKLAASETVNESLSKEKNDFKEKAEFTAVKLAEVEKEKAEAKLDADVADLLKLEGACDAMKPYLRALLGEDKKVYSVEKKDHSKTEMLKALIKFTAESSKLNKQESTIEGEKIPQGAELDKEIKAYIAEQDCSYADGYRAICKKYNVK